MKTASIATAAILAITIATLMSSSAQAGNFRRTSCRYNVRVQVNDLTIYRDTEIGAEEFRVKLKANVQQKTLIAPLIRRDNGTAHVKYVLSTYYDYHLGQALAAGTPLTLSARAYEDDPKHDDELGFGATSVIIRPGKQRVVITGADFKLTLTVIASRN